MLIIDVQGKLSSLMHEKDELIRHIVGLIRVADIFNMPIIFTEQAPEKIGTTIPEIAESFNGRKPIAKHSFSCCGDKDFMRQLKALYRKQVIVAGIEAHVCISQTVCDLLAQHYEVQVVSDAISSRAEADKAPVRQPMSNGSRIERSRIPRYGMRVRSLSNRRDGHQTSSISVMSSTSARSDSIPV